MIKDSYFIGLDPSFSHFGVSIIDTKSKTIYLDDLRADDHHNFIFMCWSIANLWNNFESIYKEYLTRDNVIIAQEAPIASGINSGKLNALGLYFYLKLGESNSKHIIKTYHPMKLKSFHHKKKYTKQDTINVVEKILEYFKLEGYKINVVKSRTKKTINITDGEADSFIYALVEYVKHKDDLITKKVLDEFPRISVFESIEEGMVYYDKE